MDGQAQDRLSRHGLRSERVLSPCKGPGAFEQEVAALERTLGLTTMQRALAWVQTHSMWPANFGLSCCAIEMMAASAARYRHRAIRHASFRPTPRQADLMIVAGTVSYKMAAPCGRSTTRCPSRSG